MRISTLVTFLAILFIQCGTPQNILKTPSDLGGNVPPNAQPGKCYAQCIIPDKYELYDLKLAVYTGKESDDVTLETVELNTSRKTSETFKLGLVIS